MILQNKQILLWKTLPFATEQQKATLEKEKKEKLKSPHYSSPSLLFKHKTEEYEIHLYAYQLHGGKAKMQSNRTQKLWYLDFLQKQYARNWPQQDLTPGVKSLHFPIPFNARNNGTISQTGSAETDL